MFRIGAQIVSLLILTLVFIGNANAQDKTKIVHDAEYYVVEVQNKEKWAAEDKDLDARLAELREKHGTPPNIIHIMFDDLAFGDLGIPAMAAIRGFNTPNIDRMAGEGMKLTSFYSTCAVCTPSRASLMTGCYPKRVNLATGSNFVVLLAGDSKGLHPDEKTIALSLESMVQLRSVDDWALGTDLPVSTKVVNGMAFSPDGRWFAAGAADRKIRIWENPLA